MEKIYDLLPNHIRIYLREQQCKNLKELNEKGNLYL